MNTWTDADFRMQAHRTTTDRINRQAWQTEGEPPAHGRTVAHGPGVGRRVAEIVLRQTALLRKAGRSPRGLAAASVDAGRRGAA